MWTRRVFDNAFFRRLKTLILAANSSNVAKVCWRYISANINCLMPCYYDYTVMKRIWLKSEIFFQVLVELWFDLQLTVIELDLWSS